MSLATGRRLQDELNVNAMLEYVYKFTYQARFGDAGSEHELCHVYLGQTKGEVKANEHEIQAVRYVSAEDLEVELASEVSQFTPWFKLEWRALCEQHAAKLADYTQPT